MFTINGKDVIFCKSFSMALGDEVVIAPAGVDGRVFRFKAVQRPVNGDEAPPNFEFNGNEIYSPIPFLDVGNTGLENPFLGVVGGRPLSARFVLEGAGKFTMLHVELYLDRPAV